MMICGLSNFIFYHELDRITRKINIIKKFVLIRAKFV